MGCVSEEWWVVFVRSLLVDNQASTYVCVYVYRNWNLGICYNLF